jgi:heterocyst glycolipid deposition protein
MFFFIFFCSFFWALTGPLSLGFCGAGVLDSTESGRLPENGKRLTLARAVEIALINSPKPKQAIQAIIAAQNRYQKSRTALYPTLGLSGSMNANKTNYSRYDTPSLGYIRGKKESQLGLVGRYLLYDGFFTKFSTLVSLNRLESEKSNGQDVARLLAEAVKISYNSILLVKKEIEINRDDLSFQENMLRESRLKRAADLVAEPHVLNFLLRRNRARRNLLAKEHDLGIQRTLLAQVMGLKDSFFDKQIQLSPFPVDQLNCLDLAAVTSCLSAAMGQRPDLQALKAAKLAATYTVKAGKSKYGPTVSLVGNAGYEDTKTYYKRYTDVSSGYYQYAGMVLFSWDLYDASNRKYGILAAAADEKKIESQIAEKWLAIASEVRTSHAQIQKALELYAISLENIEIQKKQRELVTEQFRAGEVDLAFLNETQQELVKLEQELAISGFSILSGMAALESALGVSSGKAPLLTHNLW